MPDRELHKWAPSDKKEDSEDDRAHISELTTALDHPDSVPDSGKSDDRPVKAPNAYTWEPPDGGYGWVIVACSFLLNFCMSGMIASFGFLLVEMMAHFNVEKVVLAWIGALEFSIGSVLGRWAS